MPSLVAVFPFGDNSMTRIRVLVSLHTGLRNGELRLLRRRQIDLFEPKLTVGKSKTVGGDGRIVPLSKTALQCLLDWRSLFPNALPAH
jgi:integrase